MTRAAAALRDLEDFINTYHHAPFADRTAEEAVDGPRGSEDPARGHGSDGRRPSGGTNVKELMDNAARAIEPRVLRMSPRDATAAKSPLLSLGRLRDDVGRGQRIARLERRSVAAPLASARRRRRCWAPGAATAMTTSHRAEERYAT